MDYLYQLWNIGAPILFLILTILSLFLFTRTAQKFCTSLILKISKEVRSLFKETEEHQSRPNLNNVSPTVKYTSLFMACFLSLVFTCFLAGLFMLYAVSELFASFDLSVVPSFFNSVFEWIALTVTGIFLLFMGIYLARILSFYIHKLHANRAHLYAQITSAVLLIFFVFLSLIQFNSAIQFINLSLIIISASIFIAFLTPFLKYKHPMRGRRKGSIA